MPCTKNRPTVNLLRSGEKWRGPEKRLTVHGSIHSSNWPAQRPPASWTTGANTALMFINILEHNAPTHRVRLFKRGDALSSDAKEKKLQREFRLTTELTNLIYWTNVGRVGFEHFRQQLREKTMASRMCTVIPGEVTAERAHKMLRKSVEVQGKADAEKSARVARSRSARTHPARNSFNRSPANRRSGNNPRFSRPRSQPARSNQRPASNRRAPARKPTNPPRRA